MAQAVDFNISPELQRDLRAVAQRALAAVGVVGLLLTVVGAFIGSARPVLTAPTCGRTFSSWVWPWARMAWLMLQYLTGGAWGVVIRRPAEAAARTLPLLALLFIPIVIGIPNLYPWSHPDMVAADPVLQHKHISERAVLPDPRRGLLCGLADSASWLLNRWSADEDRGGTGRARQDGRDLRTGPGLLGLQRHLHVRSIGCSRSIRTGSPPCSACCSWRARGFRRWRF